MDKFYTKEFKPTVERLGIRANLINDINPHNPYPRVEQCYTIKLKGNHRYRLIDKVVKSGIAINPIHRAILEVVEKRRLYKRRMTERWKTDHWE